MQQRWSHDVHFGHSEVDGQVIAIHLVLDIPVPDGVLAGLVHPWVE